MVVRVHMFHVRKAHPAHDSSLLISLVVLKEFITHLKATCTLDVHFEVCVVYRFII